MANFQRWNGQWRREADEAKTLRLFGSKGLYEFISTPPPHAKMWNAYFMQGPCMVVATMKGKKLKKIHIADLTLRKLIQQNMRHEVSS